MVNKASVNKFLFLIILAIGIFLRLFMLGETPAGLTNDEADIGYDAYSLLLTGKDQWGEFMPLTAFKGFGDFRLPLYTYLTIPVVKFAGLNEFAVRLPSALAGIGSIIIIYFLSRKLVQKTKLNQEVVSLSAMFFMAVSPWAVGLSRIGIESNVGIAIFLAAFLSFLFSEKNKIFFFISIFLFALTFYTYTSFTLFTPLAVLIIFYFYRKKITKKQIFTGVILLIVLVSFLFVFRSAAGVRASQISFFSSQDNVGILADLNERRGNCSEVLSTVICKILENKTMLYVNTLVKNYLNHFSFNFLYLDGTNTQFSILPARGLFYLFELVFFILGIFIILKNRLRVGYLIISLLVISPIADSLTGAGHFSRASIMMPFMFIVEAFGTSYGMELVRKIRKKRVQVTLLFTVFGIVSVSICYFFINYATHFSKSYAHFSQDGYRKLVKEVNTYKNEYEKIYISSYKNDTKQYIYFLFYTKYNPTKFQEKENVLHDTSRDGWVSIKKLENIYFVDMLPLEVDNEANLQGEVLLVGHPEEFSEGYTFMNEIKNKKGDAVFGITSAQDLLQYNKIESLKSLE